jgi:ribose 5-phosphate isomerase B
MKIGVASDHAGFQLKEEIKNHFDFIEFEDFGTHGDESVDYPDYAHPLAQSVLDGKCDYGISICGSGNGINMTVNKYKGIRAALCWNVELAELARQHNNANILSLPARFIDTDTALEMVKVFLQTPFEGGRHERRVEKINPQ